MSTDVRMKSKNNTTCGHKSVLLRTLIFALVSIMLFSHAKALKLQGTIFIGSSSEKVIEANLYIPMLEVRARTDRDGSFSLDLPDKGSFNLEVTHVSFEKQVIPIDVHSRDLKLEIRMLSRTYISDEVVVTGTRTPYLLKDVPVTTEVIRTEDAVAIGATTVDQALKSAVGVNIDNNLSGAGVSMRGIDPARVLVLVDGEKVVGRVRGALDLAQMPLANVEKIEVVKGVGSTLYGTDAIGGVVNIITRKPQSDFRLHSSAEYGTFATYNQILELEGKVAGWGLQTGARVMRTDGFDLTPSDVETIGQERIKQFNFDGKARRKLARSLDLVLNGKFFSENKRWIEADTAEGTRAYDDEENNYRYSGGGRLTFQPNPKTMVDGNLYATYYDHLWAKSFLYWTGLEGTHKAAKVAANPITDQSRTEDFLTEASVTATHSYKEGHVITMGSDVNYQSLTTVEVPDGKKEVRNADVYMQYEWKPFSNLTTLPGVRLEEHSSFGEHVNASINVMYNPHPRLRFRGFYGGGFRAPSIKEIYFRFDHSAAGYLVEGGGSSLKPEKSKNSSVTVEYSYAGIGLHRATYFYNRIDNLIDFALTDANNPRYPLGVYKYQNVFKAYTRGLEWQSEVKINHHMSFSLTYTYLEAKDIDSKKWLLNRPRHSLKIGYSFDMKRIGTTATIWGSYYSKKLWAPRNSQNLFTSDLYAPPQRDLNLSIVKQLGHGFDVFARGENLTDDVEVDYRYWPGRRFFVGVRMTTDKQN